jgi:hypothetical protein
MAYPALSMLAIDVLSALSMSAENKRVFSGCWGTVTWQTSCLSSDIVSYSECSKGRQRSGVAAIPLITSINDDNSDVDDNVNSYRPLGGHSAACVTGGYWMVSGT